ncbi:MAG: FG-GAP-like repeat-containing protein [candidate division KSB1 bacterium]|nr:FG-GAP-like repeat-containing protein [candidate division KSB1 bacterium]MDZ7335866.1 FG-GAP-like repeat-containing protein [candidate division KSB1 bacterium]MDZ7357364.1 FG-GAP-like repeat-containing protein [candidate division KSB1 bacterium]MDZ7375872.1 FG-GAP-like repeat-containing protein [candidate division KSB1 bacterium]MDZ7398932.1 FG-GAP-like repeat-containing protein [candidate division KSB1 bacterium]
MKRLRWVILASIVIVTVVGIMPLLAQDPFIRIIFENEKGASKGVAWGDYNNDGYPDLYVTNGAQGYKQLNFLYRNNGDGTFTKITSGPPVEDQLISGGCSWGDFDNDGDLDLYVATNTDNANDPLKNNCLYENNGDGTFTKNTTAGPPVNDKEYTATVGWGDYNNDGFIDIFVKNGWAQKQANSLYANNGDGTFTDITGIPLVSSSNATFISTFAWGDYDNDGDLDLAVAGGAGPNNAIWRNDGNNTFVKLLNANNESIIEGSDSSGPSWADYDNDGDLDLFITNFGDAGPEKNFLYRNDGNNTFTKITDGDVVNDVAYSYGSAWGDIDNDGDLDLFVGNDNDGTPGLKNFLYMNNGDGTFTKNTTSVALDSTFTYGVAFADYNRDGFVDLFTAREGKNILFKNNGPNNGNTNHWIHVKCVGTTSNRAGIGAKVRVKATINSQVKWQMREICAQNGYGGHDELAAHFGLGNATIIDELRVEWPSGNVQTFTNVPTNQFLTINESGTAASIRVTSPNGGETWQVGNVYSITWTSSNTSGEVDIELSTNGGGSWSTIATNEPDDGSYSWTVPNQPSTNCLIRISDSDGDPFDTSDQPFSIVQSAYNLTMAVDPAGSGTTEPTEGVHSYPQGTVVTVIAKPGTAWEFSHWTGDVADPNNDTTTVTMNGDKTVTAHFSQKTCVLTMVANPEQGGTTNPSPGNHIYVKGAVVTIIAIPANGYTFANWTGDVADPNNDTTTVTMNNDKTVTANFNALPVPITDLRASVQGTHLLLEWSAVSGATGYNVYRDTRHDFIPDQVGGSNRIAENINDEDPMTEGVQWTDTGNGAQIVGDVNTNYFYRVTAIAGGEIDPSNVAGEFDYQLKTTATTDINEIAVIMHTQRTRKPILTAEDLANAIPYCTDVYRWDASGQGIVGHVKGLPFNNFEIVPGYPYMINVTKDTVWTVAGSYSDTSFQLITTNTTDINHIAVPLGKDSLTTAEELGKDIPNCTDVYYWNSTDQGLVGHVVGLPFANFEVKAGHAYYVNVTANTVWPQPSGLMGTSSVNPSAHSANLSLSKGKPFQGVGTPHTVYGQLIVPSDAGVVSSDLELRARLKGRGEEIVVSEVVGSGCDGQYWWIAASQLIPTWQVGDSLQVIIREKSGRLMGSTTVRLSKAGSDFGGTVVLSNANIQTHESQSAIPQQFVLYQNYPNPFNPETQIIFELPQVSQVKVQIYDISGRLVRILANGSMNAGRHQLRWDGRDEAGKLVSTGIYLCRLEAAEYQRSMKLILAK